MQIYLNVDIKEFRLLFTYLFSFMDVIFFASVKSL